MEAKKHTGRFCLQFNLSDPRHLQAIELLERQGRRKAQFIVEAVLRKGNPAAGPDMAQLKQLVEQLLDKQPQVAPLAVGNGLKEAIQSAMAGLG